MQTPIGQQVMYLVSIAPYSGGINSDITKVMKLVDLAENSKTPELWKDLQSKVSRIANHYDVVKFYHDKTKELFEKNKNMKHVMEVLSESNIAVKSVVYVVVSTINALVDDRSLYEVVPSPILIIPVSVS